MTKAFSRKFRGLDYDARESARAEARRSGKGLGDWLDDAIRDKAEDDLDEAFDRDEANDDGDRLDAVARRLARSRGDADDARRPRDDHEQPRRWRDEAQERRDAEERREASRRQRRDEIDAADREPRGRRGREKREPTFGGRPGRDSGDEPRLDPQAIVADAAAIVERRVAESERHTARAFENLADLIKRGQRGAEGQAVKRAVAALAQRAAESERQTARALNNIAGLIENGQRGRETAEEGLAYLAERLGRIESRLSEQPAASASVRPIRSALARLESRLDRLSSEDRTADFEYALSGLDQRLAEIARRLDDDARDRATKAAAPAASAAPPPAPAVAAANLNGASAAALEQGLRRADPAPRRPLVDAIADITQRQRALDEPIAPPPAPDPWEGEPPAKRFAALNASLDALSHQLDDIRQDAGERADQQMVVMRQVEGLRREVEDMSRAIGDLAPRASVAAVETALRDLAHRVDMQRHRGVADDLLAPAERIAGELRAVIKELDPSPIVRNLHADVQTIGRRLDALQQPAEADAAAIEALAAQTREIKEQLGALAARPLPLEKIETRLFDLTQRVDALAHTGPGAAKAAAALDMGELVRSIRAIVSAETSSGFETFNRRLEQLASKFDDAVARAGARRFDELGERIDALGKTLSQRIDKSAQKSVDTAPLEQLIAKLAKKIDAALDAKPHAPGFEEIGRKIERLETRLADPAPGFEEIGRKIERLETRLADPAPGFEEIGRKIEQLETRIVDPLPAESIARIEAMLARPVADERFAELAHRIDLVHRTLAQRLEQGAASDQSADVGYIEELVRGLDHKIESALAAGAKGPDLAAIENQLAQIAYKVERLEDPSANPKLGAFLARPLNNPQLDEISQRLERMQSALVQRVEEGARVEARQNDLAALVEQLAARMNNALDPRDDAGALKALESQISALSQRLDRNDHSAAALAGIESRIGALVAQMEDAKAATTQAAEEAVRRATQDILRQASPGPGALREALERELADIRKIQDESGQRTHETLLAVHETLERVVDRLAMFEDELSEIRNAPERAAPAAAFAPAGNPAPARRPDAAARVPEPAVEPRRSRVETSGDEDLMDFLVPPGAQKPARREPDFSAPARADAEDRGGRSGSVQTDFIAAARRAAQQAAVDAEAAARAQQTRRGAARAESVEEDRARAAGKASAIGAAIQERKRPLLLGLGALVLLIGAYQIARVGIQGVDGPGAHQEHQQTEAAPAEAEAAPPAPAVAPKEAPPAPAPEKPAPPPPRMIAPPHVDNVPSDKPAGGAASLAAPVDSTPVGAIGQPNPLAAPDSIAVIKTLAQQGEPAAQYELGVRYADGRGVARDAKTAAQWFEKAAAQGLAPAQYRLGSLYEKGVGVDRDYTRARKWYLSAAEAGNARAMHNLAVLLAEGGDGGKPDYAAASEWFRKAAEFGVRDSQYNLAILCARGLGVSQSLTQSYLWFSAAADQGDADAAKKRDEVGARLDSKDLAAAKALAAGFHAKEPIREANDVLPPKGGWEAVKDAGAAARPATRPGAKAKVSSI